MNDANPMTPGAKDKQKAEMGVYRTGLYSILMALPGIFYALVIGIASLSASTELLANIGAFMGVIQWVALLTSLGLPFLANFDQTVLRTVDINSLFWTRVALVLPTALVAVIVDTIVDTGIANAAVVSLYVLGVSLAQIQAYLDPVSRRTAPTATMIATGVVSFVLCILFLGTDSEEALIWSLSVSGAFIAIAFFWFHRDAISLPSPTAFITRLPKRTVWFYADNVVFGLLAIDVALILYASNRHTAAVYQLCLFITRPVQLLSGPLYSSAVERNARPAKRTMVQAALFSFLLAVVTVVIVWAAVAIPVYPDVITIVDMLLVCMMAASAAMWNLCTLLAGSLYGTGQLNRPLVGSIVGAILVLSGLCFIAAIGASTSFLGLPHLIAPCVVLLIRHRQLQGSSE